MESVNLDREGLQWDDLALCKGMDRSLFYEKYEDNQTVAKNVDQACATCPVRKECLQTGVEEKRWGVWGGVYLAFGVPDQDKNSHKSPADWEDVRELILNDNK